jgi:hypothetical protein
MGILQEMAGTGGRAGRGKLSTCTHGKDTEQKGQDKRYMGVA